MSNSRHGNIDLDNPEFKTAWQLIQNSNRSIFLTGKAGTGKSTFLKYICENTGKNYIVLAPTGIAAVNAGGVTLHSFFKIPLKPLLPDDPEFSPKNIRKTLRYTRDKVNIIKKLDMVVIDEISMVRADIIDFIDKVLRIYSGNMREPFGGKQLLLVGDIFQLEPVITAEAKEILKRYYKHFFFFNAYAFSNISLVPIELKKIYRQNNESFIQLLDNIRINNIDQAKLNMINSRVNPAYRENPNEFIITLASRRDTVDVINEQHMAALPAKEYLYEGEIIEEFPEQNLPTQVKLILKEGAQVVFIKNDKDQRWVNGTLGKVHKTEEDYIEIELENGDIHLIEHEKWENVRYTFDEKEKTIKETVLGIFKQYPIKPAWALTIHKSQGLTFNNVIIDFGGGGAFTGGQTYVALSRCTDLNGVILRQPLTPKDIFVNPVIVDFSRYFNNNEIINNAIDGAAANINYTESLKAFRKKDFDTAVKRFTLAINTRNDLSKPLIQRFIRKELDIINIKDNQINNLKSKVIEQEKILTSLAGEYVIMGDELLDNDILSEGSVKYQGKENIYDPVTVKSAFANYNKAIALCPDLIGAYTGKGRLYMLMDEYEEAESCFRTALEIDSSSEMAVCGICGILTSCNRIKEAIKILKGALKANSRNPIFHEQIAEIYNKMGMEELYLKHTDKANSLRKGSKKKRK